MLGILHTEEKTRFVSMLANIADRKGRIIFPLYKRFPLNGVATPEMLLTLFSILGARTSIGPFLVTLVKESSRSRKILLQG